MQQQKKEKPKVKVYLGSDHGGFRLKEKAKAWIAAKGYEVIDVGNFVMDKADDYPYFALLVAGAIKKDLEQGIESLGVLACRSSAGMIIAANKLQGIRAVAAHTANVAKVSKTHNNANVVALAGDLINTRQAKKILNVWLDSRFTNERRHVLRLRQIENLEHNVLEITPGIFEQKIDTISKKIQQVKGLTDWIHIDIADGKLVGNISNLDAAAHKKLFVGKNIELHLMVENPADYVKDWKGAGAKQMIAHVEAKGLKQFIAACKKNKVESGIALDLGTSWEKAKPYLKQVKWVLVMGVQAGFSGQQFNPLCLDTIDSLKEKYPNMQIVVDGGVNDATAAAVIAAGTDRAITTSYLFSGGGSIAKKIEKLTNYNS